MQNPEKFAELAKRLGLSPQMLDQYMACKDAETNETKSLLSKPQTQPVIVMYAH